MPAEIQRKFEQQGELRRTWIIGTVIMVVTFLTIESFQHRSILGLHIIWLPSLADSTLGAITFAAILYYRKSRQQALLVQEALNRLRASEQLREDMTAMLVHDLKNPLISSTMALHAVLRRQGVSKALSEDELRFLRLARDSQIRLEDMIGDLLTIAQVEGQQMPLERQPTDLRVIVQEALQEASVAAGAAHLTLSNRVADLPVVDADPLKLRRLVDNLLTNAIKFTPAGGTIEVVGEASEEEISLTVSDTGPGIPPEFHEHIFDKFGQASTGQRMSVGLGLTFCRLVAEAHGGSIRVESEPGQGTRFVVTLPRRLAL